MSIDKEPRQKQEQQQSLSQVQYCYFCLGDSVYRYIQGFSIPGQQPLARMAPDEEAWESPKTGLAAHGMEPEGQRLHEFFRTICL
jgi:hypothetical protein